MTLHEEQERVQRAVEHSLAGMKSDPWLTQRVLARAKGEEPVKKVSAALILVIALMLVTMAVGLAAGTGLLDYLFRGGAKPSARQRDLDVYKRQAYALARQKAPLQRPGRDALHPFRREWAAGAERVGLSDRSARAGDELSLIHILKKMGGLQSMLSMLPGVGNKLANVEIDENAMKKPEAIIRSMTPRERRNPGILNASRRKRIAAGSGTTVQDVNALIRQFEQAKGMMKQMMNARGKRGRMRLPF